LAGAYLITDPDLQLAPGLDPIGLKRSVPSAEDTIVPLVVQDRMFDTNGELYFPNVGINPEHPYWVPEFLGDTIVVNGKAWPYKTVQAQRYRFLFINGSNARTYQMSFQVNGNSSKKAPVIWQIGADGGYLDAPARLANLVLMPGERADVIVDFAGLTPGTTLLLSNTAKAPYPGGAPVNGSTTGRVMQFRVVAGAPALDDSFNPAAGGPIKLNDATVRLTDPVAGTMAVTEDLTRSLTLNEVMGMRMKVNGIQYPGGPLEILLNNTMWDATTTETPQEGTTEVWEFINLTADAHPMHLHLVQFQLLNRQAFDLKRYTAAYNAAFPGALYVPGAGPPLAYAPSATSGGKYGGNPDVTPFLVGPAAAPAPNEAGWKDTIMAPPGTVTRIAVRWAPTDLATTTPPAQLVYPFDPSGGGLYQYVWHCHIVDHEDNEMMRRDQVVLNPLRP
jgi:spore coat protein A, manganese oxidase